MCSPKQDSMYPYPKIPASSRCSSARPFLKWVSTISQMHLSQSSSIPSSSTKARIFMKTGFLPFVPGGHLKPVLRGGIPVIYHPWGSPQEEKRMIEREIGRLISQGIRPERILILSPNRLENSCLAGCKTVGSWPL